MSIILARRYTELSPNVTVSRTLLSPALHVVGCSWKRKDDPPAKDTFSSTTSSAGIRLSSSEFLRVSHASAGSLSSFPCLKKLALLYLTYPQEGKRGKKLQNTVMSYPFKEY